eukprot:XP_001701145.1 predicted protein [Chlamydomonas reinhardtii]
MAATSAKDRIRIRIEAFEHFKDGSRRPTHIRQTGLPPACSQGSDRTPSSAAIRFESDGRRPAGGGSRKPARRLEPAATTAGASADLHDVIDKRLAVWSERQDVMTMSAAFNLCGKPAGCSLPLWALAKAGAASDGRVESQLAPALLQRLADPVLLKTATPQNLANALYALGKLWEEQQQRGSGWDPTSSPHLIALTGAVASRLRATEGHGFKPQHVSNSLWACAKLEYRNSDLLLPLAEAAAA